ncbi:uncharacterized protein BO72DRAFT_527616 [Aspergillus fijiensis CBS 313.89]|uniref:NmrA-like domain-containing protein n=1 Tax=Aspergillus fijiensis CBS 313.89 TaxID=1448319 RepID=A0A8G1VY73_9EURO|nr:uncharacterized protein BO72DRAFT_527616 [Aspergillus fijiensis CBS 313.89]RAK77445.1 hypothetical protein BO72DRAFT_527616 [Aspergillus fijiensis CBS 313.89]
MPRYNNVIIFGATGDVGSAAALQAHQQGATVFITLTDIREVGPSDIVPWEHAQVEIALEEIYGSSGYLAVRPAFYASNLLHEKQAILRGQVRLPSPDATFDFISSEDIGHVAGTILVNGAQERIVRLLGPGRMTLREAVRTVGHALGKEVQVTTITRGEAAAQMEAAGMPPAMIQWHLHNVIDRAGWYLESPEALMARENIQRYAQHPPQRLQQWVESNLARFLE